MQNRTVLNDDMVLVENSRKRGHRKAVLTLLSLIALFALFLVPLPYIVYDAGPTVDVLSERDGTPVIDIQGEEKAQRQLRDPQPNEGQLRMVTVSELGGPGSTVRFGNLFRAYFSKQRSIVPYSSVYTEEVTREDVEEASQVQMASSHSAGTVAAFEYLGIPIDTILLIVGTVPGSDAEGTLEEGDVLVSLETPDGITHPIDSPSVPFTVLPNVAPESTVKVTVIRGGEVDVEKMRVVGGKEIEVEVTTQAAPDGEKGSKLGVYLDALTELPFDVDIHLERIGGPSAGVMFALGIVNKLSSEDITNGEKIAGTGALDFAGNVHPIGGINQKLYGAERDGAQWFLLPTKNCEEALTNHPEKLQMVPVANFTEALDAVEMIATGETSGLPTCPVTQ